MMMWMLNRRRHDDVEEEDVEEKDRSQDREHTLREPAQVEMYTERAFHKSHFVWKFTIKTTGDTSGDIVLCDAVEIHMDTSQKHAQSHFVEIYRENAGRESHDARFVRARGLRNRNAHGHVTRCTLCETYRENA